MYWDPVHRDRVRNNYFFHSSDDRNGEYLTEKTYIFEDKEVPPKYHSIFFNKDKRIDPDYETKPVVGISFSPIKIKDVFSGGLIVFDKPFPSRPGQRVNSIIKLEYSYELIYASYTHISNAWTGKINPGMDNISIGVNLNKLFNGG